MSKSHPELIRHILTEIEFLQNKRQDLSEDDFKAA